MHLYRLNFSFPFTSDPAWSMRVDRWYQLDAAAFGLTELVWNLKNTPDFIFLASQDASNSSDKLFVDTEGTSAVRFAHTLPNVRCSPFLQAKAWSLPVFSLQYGEKTLYNAMQQALFLSEKMGKRSWVLNVLPDLREAGKFNAYAVEIDNASQQKSSEISIADLRHSVFNEPDRGLLNHLEQILCKKEAYTLIGSPSV